MGALYYGAKRQKSLQKPNTDACILVIQYLQLYNSQSTIYNPLSTHTCCVFSPFFPYRNLFPYSTSLSSLEVFQWLRFWKLFKVIIIWAIRSNGVANHNRKQLMQRAAHRKKQTKKRKRGKSSINTRKSANKNQKYICYLRLESDCVDCVGCFARWWKQRMFVKHCSLQFNFQVNRPTISNLFCIWLECWVSVVSVSNSIFVSTKTKTSYTIIIIIHEFFFLNLSIFSTSYQFSNDFNLDFNFFRS